MRFSKASIIATSASLVAAAPFAPFPLANGYPNPNATALQQIYKLAGGTLPNGPLPTSLKPAGIQTLQLLAVNELFETAYFTQLIGNITNGTAGYQVDNKDYILEALTAIVNQEEVHASSVNGVLANANATTIQPCQYTFPVTNYKDAIALASTFTEVVLGVLPQAQAIFAADGGDESALVPILGTIIGQEGQQDGWYRSQQYKTPSSAPILTSTPAQFAYTAVSQFLVPGSCPNAAVIGINALPALKLETVPTAMNSTQLFSVNGTIPSTSFITYITGARVPLSVPVTGQSTSGGRTYFFAEFPAAAGFNRGLSYAALTNGTSTTFANVSQVAAATLFGPALIQIN